MGLFLGDRPVSVFFNGASASLPVQGVFLGPVQVFPTGAGGTVPGKPTIVIAVDEGPESGITAIIFSPPANDGGSEVTGYRFFFDGFEVFPDNNPLTAFGDNLGAFFSDGYVGQSAEISAVNAIGEGPKSDPVTITAF
jgi:hypothetical protein